MKQEHIERVMLYTLGKLTQLVEKGLIVAPERLTESGMTAFRQLEATSWMPTKKEIRISLRVLANRSGAGSDFEDGAMALLSGMEEGLIP